MALKTRIKKVAVKLIHSDVNQKFKLNALFIQHKPDFGASKTLNA